MTSTMPSSRELLARLVGFPTVSRNSNLDLVGFARDHLDAIGFTTSVIPDETGQKANLLASIGPLEQAGVLLSGHTDVVPVDGQDWHTDPFQLVERDGRLFGRGTADMKGFLACALRAAGLARGRALARPLHLAFSYDEEIGCVGVRSMIERMAMLPALPSLCLVGEPTSMRLATGHKGKTALRATCRGREAHSALAPQALNAIHLAADLIDRLRRRQDAIARTGARDEAYDVPYTTVHVGLIAGGTALNIVPRHCVIDFELRTLAADDPDRLVATIREDAEAIAAAARRRFPEAEIRIETVNAYPGLDTPADDAAVAYLAGLSGETGTTRVAFGSEGGLFHARLGIPAIVCGPGSMAQGHKPDEFVTRDQLDRCDALLDRLVDGLGGNATKTS